MQRSATTSQQAPLDIVGSSAFGRWPVVNNERTLNMFTADGFSMNFAGYKFRTALLENGRGFFASKRANLMFAVSARNIYKITAGLQPILVGSIQTDNTDVSIDEDLSNNIAFCDGVALYIYNYVSGLYYVAGSFVSDVGKVIAQLDFTPNYVKFHDGRFICTSAMSGGNAVGQWRLSKTKLSDAVSYVIFPSDAQHQGGFQTKPDLPVAVLRLPGREAQIIIMGSQVTETWTDLGKALFPYQRNSTFDIDFGGFPATISDLGNYVVWLAFNEKSGPFIAYTTGEDIKKVSTNGIDSLFERIKNPELSYGFTFLISGHIFYVLTFYGAQDNISLAYDLNEDKFYDLTNEKGDFFIAKKVVLFNGKYYFISIVDGNIYEMNSYFTTYEYQPTPTNPGIYNIPRGRTCKTLRMKGGIGKVFNDLSFILEQGIDENYTGTDNFVASLSLDQGGAAYTVATVLIEGDGQGAYATATITGGIITGVTLVDQGVGYSWATASIIGDGSGAFVSTSIQISNYIPRVDLSISLDGGYTWSSYVPMEMQKLGTYRNRFYFNGLGYGNEITPKFLYHVNSRFVCSDGELSYY